MPKPPAPPLFRPVHRPRPFPTFAWSPSSVAVPACSSVASPSLPSSGSRRQSLLPPACPVSSPRPKPCLLPVDAAKLRHPRPCIHRLPLLLTRCRFPCAGSAVNLAGQPPRLLHSLVRSWFSSGWESSFSKNSSVKLVGGVDLHTQALILAQKRPNIIVGTPGRLLDHFTNTRAIKVNMLKYLVLDEADRLLSEDFQKSMDDILKTVPCERRTLLFSATMTKKVKKLQRACLRNPVKDCYLVHVLTMMAGSTTMVFTRTCDATNQLALMLRNLGFRAIPINGHMTQDKRLGALNRFKARDCNILVCTDVASRGLDIPSVDLVINYNIPSNSKDYIHRVGRTARAGRSGNAISLVNQYELEWYMKIEELIGMKLPEYKTEEEEVMLLLKHVTEAKRMSLMTMKERGSKRKGKGEDDEEEIDEYLGGKYGKKARSSSKKQRMGS